MNFRQKEKGGESSWMPFLSQNRQGSRKGGRGEGENFHPFFPWGPEKGKKGGGGKKKKKGRKGGGFSFLSLEIEGGKKKKKGKKKGKGGEGEEI